MQPDAVARGRLFQAAVVRDNELVESGMLPQRQTDMSRVGVLDYVGQRFLHDSEKGVLDRGRRTVLDFVAEADVAVD